MSDTPLDSELEPDIEVLEVIVEAEPVAPPRKPRSRLWLAAFMGATAAVSAIGRRATGDGRQLWYRALRKPALQPPRWLFAPVWTALYGLMSVSAYRVFRAPPSRARTRALRAWWAQLALNGAWSPLFFGKHKSRLALADLGGTMLALTKYAAHARKVDRPAAWLMAPYLGWLAFAGYLNAMIAKKNPRLA